MARPHRIARLLAPISLGAVALGSVHAAEPFVPKSALKKCADLISPAQRLTCYDQLAERPATPVAAARQETFGLYAAEHPIAPRAVAVTGRVISIDTGSTRHPIVTLEGDQVWELDAIDPLLKSGDAVTINRGTLGSYIMTTPTGRTHRLRRLR